MEKMNLSRTPKTLFVFRKAMFFTTLTLWVLFQVVTVYAQSDLVKEGGGVSTPSENAGALKARSETTPQNTQSGKPEMNGSQKQDDALKSSDSSAFQNEPAIHSLTFGDRFGLYTHSIIGPMAVIGPAIGSAIGQWRNSPREWGHGSLGYGRRFGSDSAQRIITHTIAFGFAAADGEDPRYHRSEESGLWPRTRHAIVGSFVTHTNSGTVIPVFSRIAGDYGAAFIVNAWHPRSSSDTSHALVRGTTALGTHVGLNVLLEFWPDIRKAVHFQPE
jgi:hypothetical protein